MDKELIGCIVMDEEVDDALKLTDEEFMNLAEEFGSIYSLKGFVNEWNYGIASYNDYSYIRFIEV